MGLLGGEVRPAWPGDLVTGTCYYIDEKHKPLLLQVIQPHHLTHQ